MIKKYRKKPVVIEAVQWTGKNFEEIKEFVRERNLNFNLDMVNAPFGLFYIITLEGLMKVGKGDWIIKGVKGEFYSCKDDIFKKTYEEVG